MNYCPPSGLNPARISSGSAVVGGGLPGLNAPDTALGPAAPSNVLSTIQKAMQDKGLAPGKLFGATKGAVPSWYRPELPEPDRTASWNSYVDGANMGAYRGGLVGALSGAAVMLAALYFGGAMVNSPKAAAKSATSRHRRFGRHRHGR